MGDDISKKLYAVDPFRRVDRSSYTDPTMPEFPAAHLLSHVALRGAQVGAVFGYFVWAPFSWIRGGRQLALFSAVMPRTAATWMIAGTVIAPSALAGLAAIGKSPNPKIPLNVSGVDDRAFRITHNKTVQQLNDFLLAGGTAALFTARGLTGRGFFGHIGAGFAWASVANLFVIGALPQIKKEWPQYRPHVSKLLKEAGIDFLEPPPAPAPAPPSKKK